MKRPSGFGEMAEAGATIGIGKRRGQTVKFTESLQTQD